MSLKSIKISEIKKDEKYLFSYPLDISKCENLINSFPFYSFILLNEENFIVSGFEFIEFFKKNKIDKVEVIQRSIEDKEALISAYNFKENFFGFNTYEKLVFIREALKVFTLSELYQKINIDVSLNDNLVNNMDVLTGPDFKKYLISGSLNLKSILQLCRWEKASREIMAGFLSKIPFSKSQQLNIIEMFEEIMFKEKVPVEAILKKLDLEDMYKHEKPQKKIIEKIFSYRYPAYQKESELWESKIKDIKLPPNVSLTHYPFFEKRDIELKVNIKKIEDAEIIVKFLKNL